MPETPATRHYGNRTHVGSAHEAQQAQQCSYSARTAGNDASRHAHSQHSATRPAASTNHSRTASAHTRTASATGTNAHACTHASERAQTPSANRKRSAQPAPKKKSRYIPALDGLRARLILQVHDELIVEAPQQEAETVCALLREEMEGAMQLEVPLTADVHAGKTWFDVKE